MAVCAFLLDVQQVDRLRVLLLGNVNGILQAAVVVLVAEDVDIHPDSVLDVLVGDVLRDDWILEFV